MIKYLYLDDGDGLVLGCHGYMCWMNWKFSNYGGEINI